MLLRWRHCEGCEFMSGFALYATACFGGYDVVGYLCLLFLGLVV